MKNRKKLISILAGIMAAVMILSLILSLIPVASAASSSEIKNQINELKEQRQQLKDLQENIEVQIQENEDEITRIVAEKNVIEQELGNLYAQLVNINQTISAYNLLIADKQDELDVAMARYEELNEQNKERVRAMEEEGEVSYWAVLFKANSFSDLLDRLNMVEEIAAADQRRLAELSDAADVVAAAKAELQEEKDGAEASRAELAAIEEEMEEKRDQAEALIKELLDKGEEIQQQLEEADTEEQRLALEIADKQKEYQSAKESEEAAYWAAYWATYVPPTTATQATQATQATTGENSGDDSSAATEATTPSSGGSSSNGGTTSSSGENAGSNAGTAASKPPSSATWLVPCSYRYVSSPFGDRDAPTAGASSNHQGVDLAAPEGTPIVATRSGTVSVATYGSAAGYYVTINHGDGFSSIYMHMTHYIVSAGQSVSAGQVIGYVGKTGVATGNHLHFGISYGGKYVNPAYYVSL